MIVKRSSVAIAFLLALPVAVRRVHDQVVRARDRPRTTEQLGSMNPEITREHEPPPLAADVEREVNDSRAENVTGRHERHGADTVQRVGLAERHGLEPVDHSQRVLLRVQRTHPAGILTPLLKPLDLPASVLFLNPAGVGQQDLEQARRRLGGHH